MPYDHRNRTPDGLASHIIKSMLEDLNHLHCQNGCLVGSGGGSVGYLAHGTSTDYMFDIIKVPMSFTFEAISKPAAWNRFSSSDMDGTDDDAASYFISAVCWKSDSPTMLTVNSQGTIKVLVLAA